MKKLISGSLLAGALVLIFGFVFSCKKTGAEASSTSGSTHSSATVSDCSSLTGGAGVACLANNFLATLSSDQQSAAVIDLDLSNAERWSNLPCALSCRNGLLFSSLSTTQADAALAVIKAAGGSAYTGEGYLEFQTIRAADDYLGTMQNGYGSGNYIIAFLGTPSATGKWMLQYGGHHYASNITYENGSVTSITPLHEGVEPHTDFTVNGTTYTNPLTDEHNEMQTMLGTFSSAELTSAKISGTFSDCLMVPGSTSNTMPSTKQGIKVSTLSTSAQAAVWQAMRPWINDVDSAQAAVIRQAYSDELANTYVCYASNTSATTGSASSFLTTNTDYVRIDGPSVWIEFICQTGVVINNQIHYHTVMRDHNRDYIGLN